MKNYTQRFVRSLGFLLLLLIISIPSAYATEPNIDSPNPDSISLINFINETKKEMQDVRWQFEENERSIKVALWHNEVKLQSLTTTEKPQKYIAALQKKMDLQEQLRFNEEMLESSTLKVRYKKGVDLIKLLYEKILALDHHFTGMQTYQNVILLSNPHTYPEFQKAQSTIEKNMKRRNAVSLPNILQTNSFMSATFSIVGTLLGDGEPAQKQEELDNISCILDFTVRMNSDLSIIQHETEYLKTANQNLKKECEKLFEDYTKVIGYFVPLEQCRQNDDWESLRESLDSFTSRMNGGNSSNYHSQGNTNNSAYGNNNNSSGYGSNNSSGYGSNNSSGYGSNNSSGYGSNNSSGYGSNNSSGYGSNNSSGYGSNNSSGYGSNNSSGYGSNNSSGYGSNNSSGYGSNNSSGYGSNNSSGYGSNNSSGYGSNNSSGYGSNNSSGYGSNNSSGYGSNNSSQNQNGGYNNSNNNNGGQPPMNQREAERNRVDLEFATQRVAEFITKYNNFITQGTQYYQKFDNIVSTYRNEDVCEGKLPRQFGELKYDIKSTIEKFINTYNLPEIQGSRMKDLLYGTVDR